jgi:tetratricopeptide (TPR) repeat protein
MKQLAGAYAWVGRAPEGIALYEEVLANARARLGPDDPVAFDVMYHLAMACRRAGAWQRAMRLLEQVVENDEALHGATTAGASGPAQILGMLYMDAGKPMEAALRLEKVVALRKAALGPEDDSTIYAMGSCAEAYSRAGKFDEADRFYRFLVERSRSRRDSIGQTNTARMLVYRSRNSLLLHRCEEAEQLAREAKQIYENDKNNRPDSDDVLRCYLLNVLGGALLGQKKYAEAEPLLLQGYEGLKQREATMIAPYRPYFKEAGERIIRYYQETNQPEKAREWREKILLRSETSAQPETKESKPK